MKININLKLDEQSVQSIVAINQQIKAISPVEIDLLEQPIRPHLTLVLADIDDGDFDKVQEIVRRQVFSSANTCVRLSKPYLSGRYVLQSVIPKDCDALFADFADLLAKLDSIAHLRGGMSKSKPPHITLAYAINRKAAQKYIKNARGLAWVHLGEVTLSRAGEHGVVFKEEI